MNSKTFPKNKTGVYFVDQGKNTHPDLNSKKFLETFLADLTEHDQLGGLMENWRTISKFPDYAVSDYGRVCNRDSGRILRMSPNPRGIITVSLSQDRVHTTKAVINLVAGEFLPRPHNREREFDTPVNRNGYREDNHIDNLMWRPQWFAIKYFRQFRTYRQPAFNHPIMDTETGIIFRNSWDAAVQYGLLDRDLLLCMLGHRYVFPTFQHFRPL